MMGKEIAAVVFFLRRLIKKVEKLETQKMNMFVERLTVALQENSGCIGSLTTPANDFRCIWLNRLQREDPELLRACQESGVQYKDLEKKHAFKVASFFGDEDVTKKVTSAVPPQMSIVASGKPVLPLPSPKFPTHIRRRWYRKSYDSPPHPPHYGFRPQGRHTQPFTDKMSGICWPERGAWVLGWNSRPGLLHCALQ
uniref:Anti-proliferative protein domain-containing protein n=1 Tax=Oncorhynchus kisutch TaxID=8019 RepID=A0A8C7DKT0_ONCKI